MERVERKKDGAGWIPLGLIVGLFFLWGMANNLNDVLIAHFRRELQLGDFASGLVQSAFYLGYFCFAMPAALVMRRSGYKAGVLGGLGLFGIGALTFWPAASMESYPVFLLALFVIASGLAFLETAANPLVALLGPPEGAARRLNLAQAFNPLGSIAGVEFGRRLILGENGSDGELGTVQGPYLVIAAVVLGWALLIASTRFPAEATEPDGQADGGSRAQYRALLGHPRFLAALVTQFCYVGAQVGVWSYLIRYAQVALPGIEAGEAAGYVTLSLVLFAAGRFIGAGLLGVVQPPLLLLQFALANVLLCLLAAQMSGPTGVWLLAATGLFMSIMYPTIFVLGIGGLGEKTKAGASLLVMAIVGGAAVTALMGLVSDLAGIRAAMTVPAGCFAVVAGFALLHRGRRQEAPA